MSEIGRPGIIHIWAVVEVGPQESVVLSYPSAIVLDTAMVHESEFRAIDVSVDDTSETGRAKAEEVGCRCKDVSEHRFGVCHVLLCPHGQDTVVGKVEVTILERVAVGGLVRAMGGISEMDDASVINAHVLELFIELLEVHTAPIKATRGHETATMWVAFKSHSQFTLGGQRNTLILNCDNTHFYISYLFYES